jgi:DNA replication protein DnaC
VIEQTKQDLVGMKCFGMLQSLDQRLGEAASGGWGHTEFLSSVVTDERIYREAQRIKRRIKMANFRTDACFDRLDLTAKRNVSRSQLADLKNLTFITEPRNVIILGPTGVGKTFLATALGDHACRKGYSTYFIGINMLIERLALSRLDGSFMRLRERLTKVDLLILDDLGLKRLPQESIQDLYDILEERYQTRSVVITSQLPIQNWREVIEDPVALEAIIDRIIHGTITIQMDGESYRKKRGTPKTLDNNVTIN